MYVGLRDCLSCCACVSGRLPVWLTLCRTPRLSILSSFLAVCLADCLLVGRCVWLVICQPVWLSVCVCQSVDLCRVCLWPGLCNSHRHTVPDAVCLCVCLFQLASCHLLWRPTEGPLCRSSRHHHYTGRKTECSWLSHHRRGFPCPRGRWAATILARHYSFPNTRYVQTCFE